MKHNKHFIPNRMAIIVLGFFAMGLFAYGAFYAYKKNQETDSQDSDILKVTLIDETIDDERFLDSDNDGAYDWVERLWPELDPFNPDSDGDGVLDGRYIQQKRRIKERERLGGDGIQSTLTESQKLGRNVYTALLAIEKSGGTIDADTQSKISDNIVDYISDLPLGSKVYLRDQLNLVPDNKKNSYLYRDEMLAMFKKYPIRASEISLIINASENPLQYMAELETAAIKYDAYVYTLAQMNVPYLIAGRHTELLNSVGQLEGALKNLTLEEFDDIIVLSSLVQIEKTMNTIINVNLRIERYFDIISDPTIFSDEIPNAG